ncbi:hypothetical protein A6035_12610 [Dietzia lutea]|uniref:Fibronectin type-III domain-containing protein n=1 Tax=Dietzia lutea TaxID=546160 RepID=A0A2S1R996_9ACTN|nr:hypothetical protein A6035_12610 [Dietzia lutea]
MAAVAASMTQVVGTMAAPAAVRTATAPISTANYFPTPLPDRIACSDATSDAGDSVVDIAWASAGPGMTYLVRVTRADTGDPITATVTEETSFRYRGQGAGATDRVSVSTVNTASGPTDETRVRSSGSVSHLVSVESDVATRCSGGPLYDDPNQPWENQAEWTPPAAAGAPAPEAEAAADHYPESTSAAEAADAADAPAPGDAGESSTTSPSPTSAAPTPALPTTTAAPAPSTSTPAGSPSPTSTASADDAPAAGEPATRAVLGGDPITVGEVQVRLDEINGEPHVIVAADGSRVCTAAVPGATAIENVGGVLTVTGGGPDRTVDTATCEVT